ncbi:MAG: cache domain-containing protein [Desulfosarcinaceae bacterium]|nr:cache domain-containing protein [Desulfosarcinaceae bacterium]
MNVTRLFAHQSIRNKLFISYFSGFVIAVLLGSLVIYYFMRTTLRNNIESELKGSTTSILNLVHTSATISLKNYLRAIVEKNRDIVRQIHREVQLGLLSEPEAKRRAAKLLLSQKIGTSGYIYCIDSQGVLQVHPKPALRGVNISDYRFAQDQKRRKSGYLEYDWRNPDETEERPKVLQMVYFEPWDWIISASAYREESSQLVNVEDFRHTILSMRFGRTGYSYVMNARGDLIIHPLLEGVNIANETDASGRQFIREILERRNGSIIYPWKNPGDDTDREKLVIFNYIPELDWIVTSSSYLEEFYEPLSTLRNLVIFGGQLSLVLFILITLKISAAITSPLKTLENKFNQGATGDFSIRMRREERDEIGQLANYFNSFMQKLEVYSKSLKKEIQERTQAEAALSASEEMFSKAFRSSPHGIAITALDDQRFINVNDSFLEMTGYRRDEIIGRAVGEVGLFAGEVAMPLGREELENHHHLRGVAVRYRTKVGEPRSGTLSAERIELWGETCILTNIEDVTEAERLEKEVMEVSEQERLSIGRDLHDDLGPHLVGIEVLVKVLQRKLDRQGLDEQELTDKIRSLTKEAIGKTRALARGLCPVTIDSQGLTDAIAELSRNVEAVFGLRCDVDRNCPVEFPDNTIATHLYYILHEAVYNAAKHGQATRVQIRMRCDNGRYCLTVDDDGVGIHHREQTDAKGMGLRIMGFRAKKIGARLDIGHNPQGGTRIQLRFL